jgi:hypothetical protein
MTRPCLIVGLLCAALSAGACRPFDINTPDSFVELDEERWSQFEYRATTADGVVVAVRALDNEQRGTLSFWAEAVRSKVRDARGYALLEEQDVTARAGVPGKQMRFGRDDAGHTYRYWVTIFVRSQGRGPRVWVIEAGGEQAVFERRRAEIEQLISSFLPK